MTGKADPFSFSAYTSQAFLEFPESVRAFSEANQDAFEAACQSVTRGASDYTTKLIEIAKANTDEAFGFARAVLGSKSMVEAFELANAHASRQFDLLTAQSKDLAELGKKVATESVEPMRRGLRFSGI